MRHALLITAALMLAACGAPMGSSEDAPPPADAPVTVGPDYSGDFDAIGTEPFWAVKVRADRFSLTRPDHPEVTTANPGVRADGEEIRARHGVVLTSGGFSRDETLQGCAAKTAALAAQPKP